MFVGLFASLLTPLLEKLWINAQKLSGGTGLGTYDKL